MLASLILEEESFLIGILASEFDDVSGPPIVTLDDTRVVHCPPPRVISSVPNAEDYLVHGDYNVVLITVSVDNRKYYKIQILQSQAASLLDDPTARGFSVVTNWGRVGESGQCNVKLCGDETAAINHFAMRFHGLTGNIWRPPAVTLTSQAVMAMNVRDLRTALTGRGLEATGLKSELQERLKAEVQQHPTVIPQHVPKANKYRMLSTDELGQGGTIPAADEAAAQTNQSAPKVEGKSKSK